MNRRNAIAAVLSALIAALSAPFAALRPRWKSSDFTIPALRGYSVVTLKIQETREGDAQVIEIVQQYRKRTPPTPKNTN